MKPGKLTEFENLTDSVGYAKKYHLKMDNSAVIVDYDCESGKFIVTRNYNYFKGKEYATGNPITAKNFIFVLTNIDNDEDAERLIRICDVNSGMELSMLKPQIALDPHLGLSPEQYLLFGITLEYRKLQQTGHRFSL
jgi:hypothetical protein